MTSGSSFASHISHAARPAPRAAKALADDLDDVGLQRIRLPHLVEECQSQLQLLAFLARAKVARAVASSHELALLPDCHELALLPAGHELALLPATMSCSCQPSRAKLA